jgi:hypothetical protein
MPLLDIWLSWVRIRRRKASGVSGPSPVEWIDIDAFVRRSGVALTARDIEFLEIIDDQFLASFSGGASPEEQQQALRDGLRQASARA